MKKLCVWAVAALLMAACTPKAEKATDSGLLQSKFQTEVDGKKTDLFTLRNKNNMEVCITNFGGRIVSSINRITMKKLCVWAVAALLMAACTPKAEKTTDSGLLQSNFQMEVDGKKTDLYTLRNKNNMEVLCNELLGWSYRFSDGTRQGRTDA